MEWYCISFQWYGEPFRWRGVCHIWSRNAASSQTAEGMLYHAFNLVIGHRIWVELTITYAPSWGQINKDKEGVLMNSRQGVTILSVSPSLSLSLMHARNGWREWRRMADPLLYAWPGLSSDSLSYVITRGLLHSSSGAWESGWLAARAKCWSSTLLVETNHPGCVFVWVPVDAGAEEWKGCCPSIFLDTCSSNGLPTWQGYWQRPTEAHWRVWSCWDERFLRKPQTSIPEA